ncbi:MAG: hypothetical protein A2Z14_01035 [Chloroflexi bacterium RBG_16_48_8]|nr:MAG: hypothetical protein A2Z14_01035 [Chloroflexi bacterium RBG_16_48_8]
MNKRMSYGLIVTLVALLTIGTMVVLAGEGDLPPDFSGTAGEWEGEFSIFPGEFNGEFAGDFSGGGNLLSKLNCIPQGITLPEGMTLPEGLDYCEEGESPIDLEDLPEWLVCIPEGFKISLPGGLTLGDVTLPEGLDTCGPGESPINLPDELAEKINCVPADIRLPGGLTLDDITLPDGLHVCAVGEEPFTFTLPETAPDWLVCIPSDLSGFNLPFDVEIPETWDLPTCEVGQSPVEVPAEIVDMLVCLPAKIAELPIVLPPEVADLPVCAEGENPFGMEIPDVTMPEGTDWEFSDLEEVSENFGINRLASDGYISGVGNGLFRGSEQITRSQLAVVLSRSQLGADFQAANIDHQAFADTAVGTYQNNWAALALQENLMVGYGNGIFGAEDPVTMEQILAVCAKVAEKIPVEGGEKWSDKYFELAEKELGIHIEKALAEMELDRETALQILASCLYSE